jgi:hypothetical protein
MGATGKVGIFALTLAALGVGYLLGRSQQDAALSRRESDLSAELSALQEERTRTQQQLAAMRAPPLHDEEHVDPAEPVGPPPNVMGPRRVLGRMPGALPDLPSEHKKTMTRQRYGQLFRELALSDQEADALLTVLSAREKLGPTGMAFKPETAEEQAQQRQEKAEIGRLLGPERAAEFERLRNTLPARSELSLARGQLERVGEPMTEEQQQKLLESLSTRAPLAPLPSGEGVSPEERMEQFQAWRRERTQAFRDSAESVLTPRQLQRLEEGDALMEAMRPSMGRVSGATAGSGASTTARGP